MLPSCFLQNPLFPPHTNTQLRPKKCRSYYVIQLWMNGVYGLVALGVPNQFPRLNRVQMSVAKAHYRTVTYPCCERIACKKVEFSLQW